MVIVIGGSGLVGSHLLCDLALKEDQVIATFTRKHKIEEVRQIFKHYHGENSARLFEKIGWVELSILDLVGLDELISEGDVVYHCAALVSFHKKDFYQLMKINREGTANVVNTCLANKAEILAYVSSTAAIGGEGDTEVTEKSKWKNTPTTSGYSVSKHSAEKEILRGIEEGLKAVMVNPCVILGAGNWKESSLTMLQQVDKGLSFYPPGANAIVDARDVSKALQLVVEKELQGERFLLIGGNHKFKDLFSKMALAMNKKPPSILANKGLLYFAWLMASFFSGLLGKRSPITKETIESALGTKTYSAKKFVDVFDYRFYSLDETIENAIAGRIR